VRKIYRGERERNTYYILLESEVDGVYDDDRVLPLYTIDRERFGNG
jgi:hypothetical protein